MDVVKIELQSKRNLKEVIEQFEELVNQVQGNKKGDVIFDFNKVRWITPQQSIFLSSILSEKPELYNDTSISTYLQTLRFPTGYLIDGDTNIEELFTRYHDKTYIPILKLRLADASDDSDVRAEFLRCFLDHITTVLSFKSNHVDGLRYILADLLTNIFEHSESEYAFFTFQNYPILKKMEICVCDTGIGLLETYLKNKNSLDRDFSHIKTHMEAMTNVVSGLSTKSIERGFGVHTSRNMVMNGFKGTFIYQSGDALSINETISNSDCSVDGVIFSINIPYDNMDDLFYYINFVG